MANDIISRFGMRYTNGTNGKNVPDVMTRHIGGHLRNNQPFITGYHQIIFGLPDKLFGGDCATASRWLHSTVEGFTPHSITPNFGEVQGIGQIGASFMTSQTVNREFSLTFREHQNLPILYIFKRWAAIFDTITGVSPLEGNEFIPQNQKGWCCVVITRPFGAKDGYELQVQDIEEGYIYQGVQPSSIPIDTVSSVDQTSNDTVQISTSFKFDGSPLTTGEPGVADKIVELFASLKYMGGGVDSTWDNHIAMSQVSTARAVTNTVANGLSKV